MAEWRRFGLVATGYLALALLLVRSLSASSAPRSRTIRRSAAQRVDSVVERAPCSVRRELVGWSGLLSPARQPCVLRSSRRPRVDRRSGAVAGRNADSRLQRRLRRLFRAVCPCCACVDADAHRQSRRGRRQRHHLRFQSLSHGAPRAPRTSSRLLPAAGIVRASSVRGDVAPAMAGGVRRCWPCRGCAAATTCSSRSRLWACGFSGFPETRPLAPGGAGRRLGSGVHRAAAGPAAVPRTIHSQAGFGRGFGEMRDFSAGCDRRAQRPAHEVVAPAVNGEQSGSGGLRRRVCAVADSRRDRLAPIVRG